MPALHLPAGFSGEPSALLRQQAFFDYQGAQYRRPLLRQAKPAADEMDGSGNLQARYSDVADITERAAFWFG
jgi:hypothetical protein